TEISAELLAHLVAVAHGSVRRITVNLVNLADFAATNGLSMLGMADIAKAELYKGEPPKRGV
ncbi:hypothetical protein, partial [Salmonella enterica]|uniref:hypothetical protein n=1 Tax=Salmonella enterica TaxID=28901 RepID=UPI003CE69202